MQSATSARWKKLGTILKSKFPRSQLQKIKGMQKLGVPLRRTPGRYPNPTAVKTRSTSTAPEAPGLDAGSTPVLRFQSTTLETSAKLNGLWKLEIEIPPAELGRYSVMFRDSSGISLSSLMPEGSQNLKTITVPLEPPPLLDESPRRTTKPSTLPEPSSLFSIPPISQINLSTSSARNLESSVSDSHLARPVPLAAYLPSVQDKFAALEKDNPDILNQKWSCSENESVSPTDSIGYSDSDFDALWRLVESPISHISGGEDNFFEFNSTGDPKGRAELQYCINRPDSPTIELACPASPKAGKLEEHYSNVGSDFQAAEHLLRWSLACERIVNELERHVSPLSSQPKYPEKQEDISLPSSPVKETEEVTVPHPPQQMTTERSEYASRPITSQEASLLLVQNVRDIAAAAAETRRPIPQAETDSVFDVPPPLPEKDAKFMPVSKYAARDAGRHFHMLWRRGMRRC